MFDCTDLGCMTAGLAANVARSESKQGRLMSVPRHWNGDPQSWAIGQIKVQLAVDPGSKELSVPLT